MPGRITPHARVAAHPPTGHRGAADRPSCGRLLVGGGSCRRGTGFADATVEVGGGVVERDISRLTRGEILECRAGNEGESPVAVVLHRTFGRAAAAVDLVGQARLIVVRIDVVTRELPQHRRPVLGRVDSDRPRCRRIIDAGHRYRRGRGIAHGSVGVDCGVVKRDVSRLTRR